MKRAIMMVSALLLGAGCSRPCDPSVAVYWHFPSPNAAGELSCTQAGVTSIQITIDGVVEGTFNCTLPDPKGNPVQGITLTNFALRDAYQFQIDGLDANGIAIYTDAFTFTPAACGLNTADRTLTSLAGDLAIAYTGGAGCTAPTQASPFQTTFIWFELLDQNGRVYSVVGRKNDPTSLPCGAGNATIVIPQALFGRYTLNGIQEVEIEGDNSIIVYRYNCVPTSFQHATAGDVLNAPMVQQAPGGTSSSF